MFWLIRASPQSRAAVNYCFHRFRRYHLLLVLAWLKDGLMDEIKIWRGALLDVDYCSRLSLRGIEGEDYAGYCCLRSLGSRLY